MTYFDFEVYSLMEGVLYLGQLLNFIVEFFEFCFPLANNTPLHLVDVVRQTLKPKNVKKMSTASFPASRSHPSSPLVG